MIQLTGERRAEAGPEVADSSSLTFLERFGATLVALWAGGVADGERSRTACHARGSDRPQGCHQTGTPRQAAAQRAAASGSTVLTACGRRSPNLPDRPLVGMSGPKSLSRSGSKRWWDWQLARGWPQARPLACASEVGPDPAFDSDAEESSRQRFCQHAAPRRPCVLGATLINGADPRRRSSCERELNRE